MARRCGGAGNLMAPVVAAPYGAKPCGSPGSAKTCSGPSGAHSRTACRRSSRQARGAARGSLGSAAGRQPLSPSCRQIACALRKRHRCRFGSQAGARARGRTGNKALQASDAGRRSARRCHSQDLVSMEVRSYPRWRVRVCYCAHNDWPHLDRRGSPEVARGLARRCLRRGTAELLRPGALASCWARMLTPGPNSAQGGV